VTAQDACKGTVFRRYSSACESVRTGDLLMNFMNALAERLAGRFIVIDGPDGAGKSTQAGLLREWLGEAGVRVLGVRDPGGTVIGDRIRQILLDVNHKTMAPITETMLFMASRAQLAAEVIRPAMARGQCVLGDRYISATVAYQGAAGVALDAIRTVGEIAVAGLWPDLTVILDLPADEGLKRLTNQPDRMESKDLSFHRRVRELFLRQAHEQPDRFAVVDASETVERVQRRLRQTIEDWNWAK